MTTNDTQRLRERARLGDRSAVGRLVELNWTSLLRWAHRKLPVWARSVTDTADVVQDAIARTLNRIDAIDIGERGALQAYLRQAATNRINDEYRRIDRRGVSEPLDDAYASADPSPFDAAVAIELEDHYKTALNTLSEIDRYFIVGHVELEYTVHQLACMSGKSVAATRMALRRALVRLADQMGRHG